MVTDWLAAKIIVKGWAEQIDQTNVPNCVNNLRDPLKGYPWDPKNDYHYPWQSGMTGIGYDKTSLASAKIAAPASLSDLWAIDSKKVSFLSEARDTFGLGLLKLGKDADPQTTTADDLQAVHDDIQPLVQNGLTFTGNEYLQNFAAKKTWAAMVWSGDLASSGIGRPGLRLPDRGHDGLDRQHAHPQGGHERLHGRADDELRVRPEDRRPDRQLRLLRLAGQGR